AGHQFSVIREEYASKEFTDDRYNNVDERVANHIEAQHITAQELTDGQVINLDGNKRAYRYQEEVLAPVENFFDVPPLGQARTGRDAEETEAHQHFSTFD